MQFIIGNNRHQTYFSTPDDQVNTDNPVRLMDAFIDKPKLSINCYCVIWIKDILIKKCFYKFLK